ncbi:MAG: aspartate--tRNA ligase [Oscillospiraceae bacterium]|jgi:aspartyl-tRNA synthetase|nr:aspartate--tRNA ligase [Oscillospiraceae bacterium]
MSYHRTDYCGALRPADAGRSVTLCGWAQGRRNLGGLLFVDLRDRSGLMQCVFSEEADRALFEQAETIRNEYVLCVTGVLARRAPEAVNPDRPTGSVEVRAETLTILSKAATPPFEIEEETQVGEALRLKYRYLDLRRPKLQRHLMLRHRAAQAARRFFDEEGFLEIETPMLTKSTPEGARDYLVPSRVHPGMFYALPQSPQQYKQLLMLAGFDKYFQLARCFRDEDLRADRQPDFTQIDIEMSFVDVEDVLSVNERFIAYLFKEVLDVDVPLPLPRIPHREAMRRFGSDKPDLRVGYELVDVTDIAKGCGFKVFSSAAATGGVHLINMTGCAGKFTRRDIDALSLWVKDYRVGGLAWARLLGGEMTSSFGKFLTDAEMASILARAGAQDGDLLFIVGDPNETRALTALGALRLECARRLGLLRKDDFKFLWVTEFPLFEYSEEENRYVACHHPFTAPMDEDLPLLTAGELGRVRSKAYDMVLSGTELSSGSIRIFDTQAQANMFSALGFTRAQAEARFGHLLTAFQYGVPPHGGLAFGFDRIVMLMTGADSLRDVIAFPKVQNASELMTACPSPVDEHQLHDLHIRPADPSPAEEA